MRVIMTGPCTRKRIIRENKKPDKFPLDGKIYPAILIVFLARPLP